MPHKCDLSSFCINCSQWQPHILQSLLLLWRLRYLFYVSFLHWIVQQNNDKNRQITPRANVPRKWANELLPHETVFCFVSIIIWNSNKEILFSIVFNNEACNKLSHWNQVNSSRENLISSRMNVMIKITSHWNCRLYCSIPLKSYYYCEQLFLCVDNLNISIVLSIVFTVENETSIYNINICNQFELFIEKKEKKNIARHYWFHISCPYQNHLHSFHLIITNSMLNWMSTTLKCMNMKLHFISATSQFRLFNYNVHDFCCGSLWRGAINNCAHGLRCTRTKGNITAE